MSCHCQSTDARPNKLFLGVLNLAFCIVFFFCFVLFFCPFGQQRCSHKVVSCGLLLFFFFWWVGLLGNSATYLQKKAQTSSTCRRNDIPQMQRYEHKTAFVLLNLCFLFSFRLASLVSFMVLII